ncbi:MAG: hypothetical protein AAF541_07050 [Pseudomonadota bacterium]
MEEQTPTGANQSDDDLNAWIERAKRAHELVEAVDLDKVVAHEAIELEKLQAVNNALEDLAQGGEVGLVEGVDEVVHDLSPADQERAQLMELLTEAGWGSRLARTLWIKGEETEMRAMELIPHREGLPNFETCVAPEQAVGNGYFALFISHHGIFGASIAEPPSKHHWHIARSRPYETPEELLSCIEQFSRTAFD